MCIRQLRSRRCEYGHLGLLLQRQMLQVCQRIRPPRAAESTNAPVRDEVICHSEEEGRRLLGLKDGHQLPVEAVPHSGVNRLFEDAQQLGGPRVIVPEE